MGPWGGVGVGVRQRERPFPVLSGPERPGSHVAHGACAHSRGGCKYVQERLGHSSPVTTIKIHISVLADVNNRQTQATARMLLDAASYRPEPGSAKAYPRSTAGAVELDRTRPLCLTHNPSVASSDAALGQCSAWTPSDHRMHHPVDLNA